MNKFSQTSMDNIMKYIYKKQYAYALKLLIPYCQKYPKDNCARTLCIHTLLNLGLISDARIMLEETTVDETFTEDTKNSLYYANIKLLILEGKYQKCLDYMLEHDNKFYKEEEIYYARAFCKKRLGLPTFSADFNSYVYKQIINYSKARFYNNVRKYHMSDNESRRTFNSDFPLKKAINITSNLLDKSEKVYRNLYFYETTFKYNNCGIVGYQQANYIKVKTLNDSKDIMFFYPSLNEEKAPYIDISNSFHIEKPKVKRLSQIEKFNKKYNIQ